MTEERVAHTLIAAINQTVELIQKEGVHVPNRAVYAACLTVLALSISDEEDPQVRADLHTDITVRLRKMIDAAVPKRAMQ